MQEIPAALVIDKGFIKNIFKEVLKEAVEDILEKKLESFKKEMVAVSSDELLKTPVWTKDEITAYANISESTLWTWQRKYDDFPKQLGGKVSGRAKAKWNRDEMLKFFARHPEIATTAKKDLRNLGIKG